MKLLEKANFYFGTTLSTLAHIRKHGLDSVYAKTREHDAWLGDIGIYLTINRPYVAFRFAKQKALKKREEQAVLLEAKLNTKQIKDSEILDLSTEYGMYLLWDKYIELDERINGNPYLGSTNQTSTKTNNYLKSINTKIQNIDCIAITEIAKHYQIKVVIGIFQEGDSISKTLTGKATKKYKHIPGYKGILSRTHIEICVIQPSLVTFKKEFAKDEIINILCIGSDTQKEKYIEYLTSAGSYKPDYS